jgi:hypothetical protein
MNTYADKMQGYRSQSVKNSICQKQHGGTSNFQLMDNRPEAIVQRKLQEIANDSSRVQKMRAFQEMSNNRPQDKLTAQLQKHTETNFSNIIQRFELGDEAPIREVEGGEASESANRLREISANWRGVNAAENGEYDMGEDDWFQQRMIGVADISQDIAGHAEEEGYRHFVYEVDGNPVAMQSLRNSPLEAYNGYTWIESLVTHPGTSDGGATMIEHTVNLSQAEGNNGRVVLAAYGESAAFYQRLGFQQTEHNYEEEIDGEVTEYPVYTLNPQESEYWNFGEGRWSLNYFEGRPQYLS